MHPSPPKNEGQACAAPEIINIVMRPMKHAIRPKFTLRLAKSNLKLGYQTRLMGILNITPDSFSGDGLLNYPLDKIIDMGQNDC